MVNKTKAWQLKIEIDALRTVIGNASRRLEELSAALEAHDVPPEPPPGSWLTVEVKFHSSPYWYRYLILHVPGKGYYTTGSMDENKYFESWGEMLDYFNKDDVEKRSTFGEINLAGATFGGFVSREPL